jgi:hypothetical protein
MLPEIDLSSSDRGYDFSDKNTGIYFDQNKFKRSWTRYAIKPDSTGISFNKAWKSPKIFRVMKDQAVSFGDGGYSQLCYPIFVSDSLDLQEGCKSKLVQKLLELNAKQKDFQQNTPVQDIIDPDIRPWILDTPLIPKERLARSESDDEDDEYKEETKIFKKPGLDCYTYLRSQYQWIPTRFLVTKSGKVKILGRIHNLPAINANSDLYTCIRQVFESMVPMWKRLNLIPEKRDVILKVVVKAQSYLIPSSTSYSGRWHVEGLTENIVAAGVYYAHMDPHLKGGNLKFRPKKSPNSHYYSEATSCEVPVTDGCAVVFSNNLPHRFRNIENTSPTEGGRRLFLNFFIVDPEMKIKTTSEIPSKSFITTILSKVASEANVPFPKAILQSILRYVPEVWVSKISALKFRKEARNSMKQLKSGWGWINWGNCGTVEYIRSFDQLDKYTQQEIVRGFTNTDSDPASVKEY